MGSCAPRIERPLCRWRNNNVQQDRSPFHAPRVGDAGGELKRVRDASANALRHRRSKPFVNPIVTQEVVSQFCDPNPLNSRPSKSPRGDFRKPAAKDSGGSSLVRSARGFPVHLPVPVVLYPPNRALLLLVDSSRPTRAAHSALRRACSGWGVEPRTLGLGATR